MSLKIHPLVATAVIAGILVLCFALFRGCKQSRIETAAKEKALKIADSLLKEVIRYRIATDSTKNLFEWSEAIANGQIDILNNQLARTGSELDKALQENKDLVAKHKLGKYEDTTSIVVPKEYTSECEDCFTKLENTTGITLKYKSDLNSLQNKWESQSQLYQNRFKQLEDEKVGFLTKIQSLSSEVKNATDKLEPHGRLYLSWGVLWSPWPSAAGAGFMYQTKKNFIYGAKYYYGNKGGIVETSMHFPLSIKF